jgi:hypothetical protein
MSDDFLNWCERLGYDPNDQFSEGIYIDWVNQGPDPDDLRERDRLDTYEYD